MSELEDLLRFINTNAFANLSSEAQQELLSKAEALKAKKREAAIKAVAETIQSSVEPLITDQDLAANLLVKVAGGKVEITVSQEECIIEAPKTEELDSSPIANPIAFLGVRFEDGELVCSADYIETFTLSLKKIGLERIPDLNITFGNINLVSIFPKDSSKQTLVDGMYLYVDLAEEEVETVLDDISSRLYLGLQLERLEAVPAPVAPQDASEKQIPEDIVAEYPNYSGIILTKELDWSLLNHGFTVPKVYHTAIMHAYGDELPIGKSVEITLVFGHTRYNAKLLYVRKDVIQMLWSKSSGLLDALRESYKESYDYMVTKKQRARNKKAQIKLPKNLERSFYLCSTSAKGEFILCPTDEFKVTDNLMKVGRSEISVKRTASKVLYETKRCNHIVLEALKLLEKKDSLQKLAQYIEGNPSKANRSLKKEGEFGLASMFLEAGIEELNSRNSDTIRWFSDPFVIGGRTMYLSTQWCPLPSKFEQ